MVSRIPEEAWKAAVLRIASSQSTETDEAKRLKVHKSTVSRKVAELGPTLKPATGATDATPATNATNATPEGKSGPGATKTPLEIAREAAQGAQGPEVARAVAAGNLDDAKFCVETLQNYKSAGVYLVAQFSGVPAAEPMLPRVAALSEMAKGAIAQNASWLAPMLRSAGTKEVLYAILGIEALLAYMAIKHLAKKYEPPEEPEPKPAAPGTPAAEPVKAI